MFEKIENIILLGIEVIFIKDFNGFKITLNYKGKTEYVVLPYNHLNEDKIIKYLELMQNKILSEQTPHEVSQVKCDLCSHGWTAVRPEGLTKLECPNCSNMVQFENI